MMMRENYIYTNREQILKIHIQSIVLIIFLYSFAFAQEKTYQTGDIFVTASMNPSMLNELTRSVAVIDSQQIKSASFNSVSELLQNIAGIDVKQRGAPGVQSDVSIRGGALEQTLIMIDGVKLNDSQTGHHNMDLPVSLDDIERIEILKGAGSKIFGANAFAGVINIITKKSSARLLRLKISGGSNNYFDGLVSISQPAGILGSKITLSRNKSDGYMYNTDFKNDNISYLGSLKIPSGHIDFIYGFNEKEFGANGFYSDKYPGQRERTKTNYSSINADLEIAGIAVNPGVFWRRHNDDYMLDFSRPAFYHNVHTSSSYGFSLATGLETALGTTTIAGEMNRDIIQSNSLGNHNRTRGGISAEQKSDLPFGVELVLGGSAYKYDKYGWKFWPGADLGYHINSSVKLYASAEKSFRIPTFTDLYYNSPAQKGNENLNPEEALSYEAGAQYCDEIVSASAGVFRREAKNLIDWARVSSSDPWVARNITDVNTNGFELNVSFIPENIFSQKVITKFKIGYTYIESDKAQENMQSRYVMEHLKHQLIAGFENRFLFNIKMAWDFRYEKRINSDGYFITDYKMFRNCGSFELYTSVSNLFNKYYADYSGVPMPGRWLVCGVKLNLDY
jgi:iron complex outermembrane receptor protein